MNKKDQTSTFLLYSLERGGAERVASILTNHLVKKQKINLILINGPIQYPLSNQIKIKKLRKIYTHRWIRLLTMPIVLLRLYQYLRKENISTLYSFDTLPNILNCTLNFFLKQFNTYIRVSSHPSTRFVNSNLRNSIFKYLIQWLYPKAKKILINSSGIGADLKINFGIDNKIELFPNPINLSYIQSQNETQFTSLEKFTFIQIANFYPVKNHNLSITAFARIKHLNVQLWLIGSGKEMVAIKEKVISLGLTSQVHFLNYQSNPFQYMAAANCMVLSSLFEGSPNVLLEGLACGLPIISTDCPSGPREIIAPETDYRKNLKKGEGMEIVKYGILTPIEDIDCLAKAMEKVYHDSSFQNRKKYKQRAKDFDINKIIKQFEALLM